MFFPSCKMSLVLVRRVCVCVCVCEGKSSHTNANRVRTLWEEEDPSRMKA